MNVTVGDQLDDYLASGAIIAPLSGVFFVLAIVAVTIRFARFALSRWS